MVSRDIVFFVIIFITLVAVFARANDTPQFIKFSNSKVVQELESLYTTEITPLLRCFLERYSEDRALEEEYRIENTQNLPTARDKAQVINFVENILKRTNPRTIYETIGSRNSTSYTIDKGREMYICASDLDGSPHEFNIIKFVFIHELAHIGSDKWGHEDQFWAEFRFLMYLLCTYNCENHDHQTSFKYCKVNFADKGNEEKYCGMVINYNPLFDSEALSYK